MPRLDDQRSAASVLDVEITSLRAKLVALNEAETWFESAAIDDVARERNEQSRQALRKDLLNGSASVASAVDDYLVI